MDWVDQSVRLRSFAQSSPHRRSAPRIISIRKQNDRLPSRNITESLVSKIYSVVKSGAIIARIRVHLFNRSAQDCSITCSFLQKWYHLPGEGDWQHGISLPELFIESVDCLLDLSQVRFG